MDYEKKKQEIHDKFDKLSRTVADLLADYIVQYANKGIFEPNSSLATLEQDIIKILQKAGYSDASNEYFNTFSEILSTTVKDFSKISEVERELKQSKLANLVTDITLDNLKGLGIQDNFIKPLANEIRKRIFSGDTYANFKNYLTDNIKNNSKLTKYVGQITMDAFSQYDGALQKEIKTKFDAKKFKYIGGVIETSRPICYHLHTTFGNNPISIDELKKVLDEYCPNGIPSDDYIEINGRRLKKGAGMIEGTTIDNFDVNRGGYACEHKVRWIV